MEATRYQQATKLSTGLTMLQHRAQQTLDAIPSEQSLTDSVNDQMIERHQFVPAWTTRGDDTTDLLNPYINASNPLSGDKQRELISAEQQSRALFHAALFSWQPVFERVHQLLLDCEKHDSKLRYRDLLYISNFHTVEDRTKIIDLAKETTREVGRLISHCHQLWRGSAQELASNTSTNPSSEASSLPQTQLRIGELLARMPLRQSLVIESCKQVSASAGWIESALSGVDTVASPSARDEVRAAIRARLHDMRESDQSFSRKWKTLQERKTAHAEIRNRLVESNMRLVRRIARTFRDYRMSKGELIHHGCIGLIRAIERFDLSYNVQLSTFAHRVVRQEILQALTDTTRTIRISRSAFTSTRAARDHIEQHKVSHGQSPSDQEVKEATRENQKVFLRRTEPGELIRVSSFLASLDYGTIDSDERTLTPGALLTSSEPSRENDLINADLIAAILREVENSLEPRLRFIIRKRFALDHEAPKTFSELGKTLGVTLERVRQLETEALHKLRFGKLRRSLST